MKLKEKYFNFTEDMVEDLGNFLELYYYKILRVNLTTDTYEVILLRSREEDSDNKSLTGWMREFAEKGGVDPKDKEEFMRFTDIEYLRAHVEGEFWFKYGHKAGNQYPKAAFILMPSVNYSDENQECILFIKEIELPD